MEKGGGGGRRNEKWAKGKAGQGGAVVINLIRERKGPGAYMIINPHNGKIIFISQFSSLYTLPSSVSVFFWSVVTRQPHFSFSVETPLTPRRCFVMPSTVYCCITHQNMQQHLSVTHLLRIKHRQVCCRWMHVCQYKGVCISVWVGELSHIYKPIIISLLISLCSEEINFLLCRYVCARVCICAAKFPLKFHPLFTLMSHQSARKCLRGCRCMCVSVCAFPEACFGLQNNHLKGWEM